MVIQIEFFPSASRPEEILCPLCQGVAHYQMAMPAIMRASYPDGHRRKGLSEIKEAAAITREASNAGARSETRERARKEIRKLGVRPSKDL